MLLASIRSTGRDSHSRVARRDRQGFQVVVTMSAITEAGKCLLALAISGAALAVVLLRTSGNCS